MLYVYATDQLERLREEAAAEIADDGPGAPGGYRRFHVKFGFDVAGSRAVAAAASASAAANEAAAQVVFDDKRHAIATIEAKIASMGSGGGPSWIRNPFKKVMQLKLQQETVSLAPLEQALTAAAAENRRWQNAMKLIDQLASIPSDTNPYVLAMVCDRLPKAPDPDPAVFA